MALWQPPDTLSPIRRGDTERDPAYVLHRVDSVDVALLDPQMSRRSAQASESQAPPCIWMTTPFALTPVG